MSAPANQTAGNMSAPANQTATGMGQNMSNMTGNASQ